MAIVGIVQGRFLQPVVWIMESRLGVRAADAKTPSHYHYHVPPQHQPHRLCVCTSACLQHCSILVLQRAEEEQGWGGGRGTDAILIIGQGLHWTGVCVH